MTPSRQNPWSLLSTANVFIILLLHTAGAGGTNLTIVNQCSETIWAVIGSASGNAEKKVPANTSLTLRKPDVWNGRVWGKTGCTVNGSGCATGDTTAAVTLADLQLGLTTNDFYGVTLVNGFNLPMVVTPIGGSGSCGSTGCTEDLNKRCPAKLRTDNGAACQGPCTLFKTAEYCCTGTAPCGPTNYSRLFKEGCPRAYSYPLDDSNTFYSCEAPADYTITFCPPNDSLPAMTPAPTPSYRPNTNDNPQQRKEIPPAPGPGSATAKNNPQQNEGNNNAKEIIAIVVSVVLGGAIIVSIIVCCSLKRRHSQNTLKRKCNQEVESLLLQHASLAPKRYIYSEIKKITKSLSDKLGRGGYGSVYKGLLPDGRLVAVKILTETESDGGEFINEVVSISRTSHVNIVKLLGFCYEEEKRALVYEFMPNKSLDIFLGGKGDCFLDLKTRYEIAVGVARGLEYLHTGCATRIVHFDIKPQNILLDEEMCPKISDFGLAKLCKKKQSILSVLGTRGTIGYIAPEVFSRNFGEVSHKSDVYSYGIMLLEMVGAKDNVEIQSSENYFPDKIYEQVIMHGVANNVDELGIKEEEEARKKMFMVGFWCIQTIPSERPLISKVVEMLEGSVASIQTPPKPVLCHYPSIQT